MKRWWKAYRRFLRISAELEQGVPMPNGYMDSAEFQIGFNVYYAIWILAGLVATLVIAILLVSAGLVEFYRY